MGRVAAQQAALVERLQDQRDVALPQVPHAAVDQLGTPARGSLGEVRRLDQGGAVAPCGGVDRGAQIIDINMGCPAKKVCRKAAGSALLQDESLVADILVAVVAAVDVPVTLKYRTGWDREHRNAVRIGRIAEDSGVRALAIHGRTREDRYRGQAEYETIARVKESVTRYDYCVIVVSEGAAYKNGKFLAEAGTRDARVLAHEPAGSPPRPDRPEAADRQGGGPPV